MAHKLHKYRFTRDAYFSQNCRGNFTKKKIEIEKKMEGFKTTNKSFLYQIFICKLLGNHRFKHVFLHQSDRSFCIPVGNSTT